MTAHDRTNHHHHSRRTTRPRPAEPSRPRETRAQAPTSLQVLASTFHLVTTGPDPLTIDGAAIGYGLPRRRIALGELRAILAHPATPGPCRDAVWRHLVHNARTQGPSWLVGAAGVALPDMEAMATELAASVGGDRADLHAAVLAGFVEGLGTIEITRPGIITRLRWMAYRTAVTSRHRRTGLLPLSTVRCSHRSADPGIALFDAIATGTVSPVQAELIARIRIDQLPLADVAAHLGITAAAARAALARGEAALSAIGNDGDAGHRRSCSAPSSGRAAAAGPVRELGGVRGRSTTLDGTSEFGRSADLDEEGVFCCPAHHPTTPNKATGPAGREHTRRRCARPRCTRARTGGSCDRPGGETS